MSDLYNKIDNLCKENGTNITQMCLHTGVSRGSLTDLKAGRSKTLTNSTLIKIASFFNVTTDYLNGLSDSKKLAVKKTPTDIEIKSALFNDTENVTDEMLNEVKQFAEMVKLREEQKRKNKIMQSENNDEEIEVFFAARSKDNKVMPTTKKMKKSEWERLKNLPETDDDF